MDLYFASAEQPSYLQTLEDLGVKHVSISYYEWERRHQADNLRKFVPPELNIILTPGIAKKEGLDYAAFSRSYIDFCERNAEDALIYDLDSADCPIQIRRETRKHLTFFPNLVVFPMEDESHADLAGTYERIGVNANFAKSIVPTELKRIPATLYGSNITNPKVLGPARFTATTSMAWLSARRYGELWLFIRGQLRHFQADQVQRACRAYRDDIIAIGGDPDECAASNKDALTLVGVKSLLLMSESLSGRLRDRVKDDIAVISPKGRVLEVHADSGTTSVTPMPDEGDDRERVRLPVLQGGQANPSSLRMCDSCDLSSVCPKYNARSSCAFEIPADVTGDDALAAITKWQFDRIAFSVFAEQVNGGQPLPKTGQEMDRYMKLLASIKEIRKPDDPTTNVFAELFKDVTPPGEEDEHGTEEDYAEDAEVIEDTPAT